MNFKNKMLRFCAAVLACGAALSPVTAFADDDDDWARPPQNVVTVNPVVLPVPGEYDPEQYPFGYKNGVSYLIYQAAQAGETNIPVTFVFFDNYPMPKKSEFAAKYELSEADLRTLGGGFSNYLTANLPLEKIIEIVTGEEYRIEADYASDAVVVNDEAVPVTAELFGYTFFDGAYSLYTSADCRIEQDGDRLTVNTELLTLQETASATVLLQKKTATGYQNVERWRASAAAPETVTQADYDAGNATVDAQGRYYYNLRLNDTHEAVAEAGGEYRAVAFLHAGSRDYMIYAYPDGARKSESGIQTAGGTIDREILLEAEKGTEIIPVVIRFVVGTALPRLSELKTAYALETLVALPGQPYTLLSAMPLSTIEQIARNRNIERIELSSGSHAISPEALPITGDIFGFTMTYSANAHEKYISVDSVIRLEKNKVTVTADLLTLEPDAMIKIELMRKGANDRYKTVQSWKKTGNAPQGPYTAQDMQAGRATGQADVYIYNFELSDSHTVDVNPNDAYMLRTTFRAGACTYVAYAYPDDDYVGEEGIRYLGEDINADGKINSADARIALRLAAHLDPGVEGLDQDYAYIFGDTDGDGAITSSDARTILRTAAKLF